MALSLGIAAVACGDDGGSTSTASTAGDTAQAGTSSSTGDGVAQTSDDAASTDAATSTGVDPDSTGGDTTPAGTSTDSGDASSGSSGIGVTPIELFNDGWFDGAGAVFMGGFVQDECWASTYVPEPEHYPFVVDAATLVVGGTNEGAEEFTVALWTVDDQNRPDAELGAGSVEFTGIDSDIDTVNLGLAGIESPVFDEGNFALVVCLAGHSGFPAIAADADGQVDHPDRNWIRIEDGAWIQSTTPGVGGDWIMRAIILPAR